MRSVFDGYEIRSIYGLWCFIKNIPTFIKWGHQRIHKGYCDRDYYCFCYWFLEIVPDMLEELNENRHGYFQIDENGKVIHSFDEISDEQEKIYSERYGDMLKIIARYLRESTEENCSMKNPYDDALHEIYAAFEKKYGLTGEKLMSTEEREKARKTGEYPYYSPSDVPAEFPEFEEIRQKHLEYDVKIRVHREKVRKVALDMFAKYFDTLVD